MADDISTDEAHYWGRRIWRYVGRAWPKLKKVKGPFFGLLGISVLLVALATFFITRALYVSDIAELERQKSGVETANTGLEATNRKLQATIENQREHLNQIRHETKTQNIPAALKKIQEQQEKLAELEAETTASVSFSNPDRQAEDDGTYHARSQMRINSATIRSGLVIGITAKNFIHFKVLKSTNAVVQVQRYNNPNAWLNIGLDRYWMPNVSGAYLIEIKLKSPEIIIIRHALEGWKKEGPVVTWQVPEP